VEYYLYLFLDSLAQTLDQNPLPVGVVHANVGHEVTLLTFSLRFLVRKPTYDKFANGQSTTTTSKNTATMVAKPLAPPATWS
jgi:hypothetical protein